MKLVIVSHIKYDNVRRKILKNLQNINFPLNKVILIINDNGENNIFKRNDGYTEIYAKDNKYEYIAYDMINYFYEQIQDDKYLIIHDTCTLKENFTNKFLELEKTDLNCDYWSSLDRLQFNIGIYSKELIFRLADAYKGQIIDKNRALLIEHQKERLGISKFTSNIKYSEPSIELEPEDAFGFNNKRKAIYLPSLDIIKYFKVRVIPR